MISILKNWTLPIALLTGILFYEPIIHISFLSPFLIFTMLLLTFSKMSFRELRVTKLHVWLLCIQILGSIVLYFSLARWNTTVAEGILICVICPTATAAAVITSKLGGNVGSITSYTLISNLAVGIAIPIIFPFIKESATDMGFVEVFTCVMEKIFPLLICPFLLAQLLRYTVPSLNNKLANISGLSFYLWAIGLTIVTAQTVDSVLHSEADLTTMMWLAVISLGACAAQFYIGRLMGKSSGETIAAGQSLGQKNTILAIWICHTYLNPIAALGPGCYVLWQNTFNSWQLWKERRKGK